MSRSYNVAIAGATGAVGQELIETLENRNFPVKNLRLLASENSLGKSLEFKGENIPIEVLGKNSFKGVDIALFSAGGSRSLEFAKAAVNDGAVVIDNSSAFRMDTKTPLVVPEVNPEDIKKHQGIIANPNCTSIILVVALKPLYDLSRIVRVIVSTYQSASGAGAKAMEELYLQSADFLNGKKIKPRVFPHQIAFNLFSHNSAVGENGYCEEEMKVINETRKIMHDQEIKIGITTIRVPVFRAHSESVTIETERKISVKEARAAFKKAPGISLIDNPKKNHFPMPIEVSGNYNIAVGRIREDYSCDRGLALFVCGDQLLKGAALNAVQIAELL